MDSTKIPKRSRSGKQMERIFEKWLMVELRKKGRWIIGGALLLAALIAIFLMIRL